MTIIPIFNAENWNFEIFKINLKKWIQAYFFEMSKNLQFCLFYILDNVF